MGSVAQLAPELLDEVAAALRREMLGAQGLLGDGAGPLKQREGLAVAAQGVIEECEGIEGSGGVWVIGAEDALADGAGALGQRKSRLIAPLRAQISHHLLSLSSEGERLPPRPAGAGPAGRGAPFEGSPSCHRLFLDQAASNQREEFIGPLREGAPAILRSLLTSLEEGFQEAEIVVAYGPLDQVSQMGQPFPIQPQFKRRRETIQEVLKRRMGLFLRVNRIHGHEQYHLSRSVRTDENRESGKVGSSVTDVPSRRRCESALTRGSVAAERSPALY
jgi:hypothetical protein